MYCRHALHIIPRLILEFDLYNKKSQKFFKTNYDNTNVMIVNPEVDDICIFPSKTLHSTSPNKSNEARISISADISIFAKKSENIEQLTTPVHKWLKF